ncbi:TetR family transcriptional regulator [Novosphingobium sp. FSY-8]|uniref:TetR family transcriptional regulator n=1 Tax=Novosphingobium ovatum TaxID=1908523 RepID=A0ABW9XD77_9SPHN|nr:TetR/AcrR family transcriptional regulator [Novosphingobium ovatum]NBC36491.1 TetR family transcriptional regulator [Novosphingobium ovatum]
MSIKRRLSPEESRMAALEAARLLLIEQGPQAVTLKAVAARIGRTHANLLHHFGSAAELQKALALYMGETICASVKMAVIASRRGAVSARALVDMTFDAFDTGGGGQLVSWMRLTGNEEALSPIINAVHDMVEDLHDVGSLCMRHVTKTLILLALGDALMGHPLADSLGLKRGTARDVAERLLISEWHRLGVVPDAPPSAAGPDFEVPQEDWSPTVVPDDASHPGTVTISSTRR